MYLPGTFAKHTEINYDKGLMPVISPLPSSQLSFPLSTENRALVDQGKVPPNQYEGQHACMVEQNEVGPHAEQCKVP